MPNLRLLVAVALVATALPAWTFEQSFVAPPFTVSVPRLPNISVAPPGAAQGSGAWTARGEDATYAVEVVATASAEATSTRICAGASLRELTKRPHMPKRDDIYRAPIDQGTFLVLYVMELDGKKLLHAHLLAAVANTHCVDAHFSRSLTAGEDIDTWRTAFGDAAIRQPSK